MLTGSTYCCEVLHSYCNIRIYSATQGYNVVLFCIMINVEVEGCIMPLKGGGGGAYRRAYSRSLFYDVRRHEVQ